MNKVIAIICEYNPFHNGHKYQIDKIKKEFPNSTIIAIMSGNIVQRGDMAIFDKYSRAEAAVLSGVNAVFEMPFPFSCSNAEIFAFAGVRIATDLQADYLCFGSECANLEYLSKVSEIIDSASFENEFSKALKDKEKSYIVSKEKVLSKFGIVLPKDPNDMLAVEYLRAIRKINSKIIPYPIKRTGAAYKDLSVSEMMSASAIRRKFYDDGELVSVSKEAKEIFERDILNRSYLDVSKSRDFLFHNTLVANPSKIESLFDAPIGVGHFISNIARESENSNEFFSNLTSKTYTHARLVRIIMYLALNVTQVKKEGIFTTLLASDNCGRDFIKRVRKQCDMVLLTKQADAKKLAQDQVELFELHRKADELYMSFLKSPQKASAAYKRKTVII